MVPQNDYIIFIGGFYIVRILCDYTELDAIDWCLY